MLGFKEERLGENWWRRREMKVLAQIKVLGFSLCVLSSSNDPVTLFLNCVTFVLQYGPKKGSCFRIVATKHLPLTGPI